MVSDEMLMPWQADPATYTGTDTYAAARHEVLDTLQDGGLYEPAELYDVVDDYTGVDGLPRDGWDLLWAMYLVEDAVDIVWAEQPSANPTAAQLGVDVTGMYYAIDPDHIV